MQIYNNNQTKDSFSKQILLNAIDFLRYKVENDSLTVGEAQKLAQFFCEGLDLQGTADEFAAFYGKSKNNIRVTLCRKTNASPVRKVLYPFAKLLKAIPSSWIEGVESQK